MAKFDGDLWKTNEVAAPQSREILQTFVMWENKFAPPPPPMQTSVNPGKFAKLYLRNLVPRALFPGFGGGAGKGPGIGRSHDHQTPTICGCTKLAYDKQNTEDGR